MSEKLTTIALRASAHPIFTETTMHYSVARSLHIANIRSITSEPRIADPFNGQPECPFFGVDMFHVLKVFASALLLGLAGIANAALIIDQSNIARPVLGYFGFDPLGQTFVPTLNGIDFVTLNFSNVTFTPAPVSVSIFLGSGSSAPLLATSNTTAVALGISDAQFDFASRVALTPGTSYSFIINSQTANLFANFSGNSYAPGTAIVSGAPAPTFDAIFSEGIRVAQVPEPTSVALVGIGSLIALGAVRRGRRTASPSRLQDRA